nr:type III pantothenate kinase [Sulfurimonas sp. MAG313]
MNNKLLCDIGNTNFSFSDGKKISVEYFDIASIKEKVYYISVNDYWEKRLSMQENWINLRAHLDMSKYYKTMGIDRMMACEAKENALIIDAGSAITVDLVKDFKHIGGFIYPGLRALEKCFKDISPALDISFNFDIDLDKMPKNTKDALSYGAIAPLLSHIREISKNVPVLITGGDASTIAPLIPNAKIEHDLVFMGMKKILEGKKIC